MVTKDQAHSGITVVVNTEAELNNAIQSINEGSVLNVIDVQSNITLTQNMTNVIENMTLTSSNGCSITNGNYTGLSISNGALVSVSMRLNGTVYNNGTGDGTTLIGLNGGAIGDLQNSDRFQVPANNTFITGTVYGAADICGTLQNSGPVYESGPYQILVNSNCNSNSTSVGSANQIALSGEGLMTITPGTIFHALSVSVTELSFISSSSPPGTLVVQEGLMVSGTAGSLQMPGAAFGINVKGEITLNTLGIYAASNGNGLFGCTADKVTNVSGNFNLGQGGTWNVGTYSQTEGILTIGIPDFNGDAPLLKVESATITGGQIQINAGQYYIPQNFTGEKVLLITASSKLSIQNLQGITTFVGFPQGMTASVEQEGNNLYLILTV